MIVDRDALDAEFQPLRGVREQHPAPYPYVLLLRDPRATPEIVEALEAGVDDFLDKPVNHAEVIARLWAGTRCLESWRGEDDLLQLDQDTGLMTRGAFARQLQRQLENGDESGCCVLMELDSFGQITAAVGWPAAQKVLRDIAGLIQNHGRPHDVLAKWHGSRFSALLPDTPGDQARQWAETLREQVAGGRWGRELEPLQLTASLGVAAWCPGQDTPAELLQKTAVALNFALEGGGNCTVLADEMAAEDSDTSDLRRDPFANAKARDVMVPAVLLLESTEAVSGAATRLSQTLLDVVPVVDRQRNFQGVVRGEQLVAQMDSQEQDSLLVGAIMTEAAVRVQEDTPLAQVQEELYESPSGLAVVLRGDEPTGLITRDHLSQLMPPIMHES